jgi:hypothetical protein
VGETAKIDWTGLSLVAVLAAVLPWRRWTKGGGFSAVPAWIVLTCVVYSLGFLIVAFESRYIVPIFMPLLVALCLREWAEFSVAPAPSQENARASSAGGWRTAVPAAMTVLFLISGTIGISPFLLQSPARPIYAEVAKALRKRGLVMPFTSSVNNYGVNVSYYLKDQKIVLIPNRSDSKSIQRELADAKVDEVLIWVDVRNKQTDSFATTLAAMLNQSKRWRPPVRLTLDTARRVDVYVRRQPLNARAASAASTVP